MKLLQHLVCISFSIATAFTVKGQAPQLINYQAVARDATGAIIMSKPISVRLTIHDGGTSGTVQYQETQNVSTNPYGLFTLRVGAGTIVSGTMSGVTWGGGNKYLQVEVDPTGGITYVDMGAQQLVSVPYALYAANGGGSSYTAGTGIDITGTTISAKNTNALWNADELQGVGVSTTVPTSGQVMAFDGTNWAPTSLTGGGGGTVTSITAGAGLSGGVITAIGTISMPNVGTAGTYGSATQVPVFTTDAQGRVTSVTNTPITGGGTGTVTTINTSAPLTGGPISTTGTIGLATTTSAGSYGTATQVPQITVDGFGRVTSAANVTIAGGGTGTVTSVNTSPRLTGGPITTSGTIDLATSGVSAGTYGTTTQVPQIAVDVYGRVTGVTNVTIAGTTSVTMGGDVTGPSSGSTVVKLQGNAVSTTVPSTGQVLQWSGAAWTPTTSGTSGWLLTGNAGTSPGTNFIGTTDPQAFMLKVNSQLAGKIDYATYSSTSYGYQALNVSTASPNCAFGYQALKANTTGNGNFAAGTYALTNNVVGINNTAVGEQALYNNTDTSNTGIGYQALFSNTTGYWNTAIGNQALYNNTTGSRNVSIGTGGLSNTTGSFNTGVGWATLAHNSTGNYNTALGYFADMYGCCPSLSNTMELGFNSGVTNSNTIGIGNSSITSISTQVDLTIVSDARVKKNINHNVPGLSFITNLKPVTFHYDVTKENELLGINDTANWTGKYDIEKISFSGFLAQDVDLTAKKIGYDFSGVDKSRSVWGIKYSEFIPSIVMAEQELNTQNIELKKAVESQGQKIDELEKQLKEIMRQLNDLKNKK